VEVVQILLSSGAQLNLISNVRCIALHHTALYDILTGYGVVCCAVWNFTNVMSCYVI
jgi:hypothetical protein